MVVNIVDTVIDFMECMSAVVIHATRIAIADTGDLVYYPEQLPSPKIFFTFANPNLKFPPSQTV
jgi:hypothetical protein